MDKRWNTNEIREAAGNVRDAWLEQAREDCGNETLTPSAALDDSIRAMKSRVKRGRSRRGFRRAAAAGLAVLMLFAGWLTVDVKARAAVLNWFREITGTQAVYYSNIENREDSEVYKAKPGWMPEGIVLDKEYWFPHSYTAVFRDPADRSRFCIVGVDEMREGRSFELTAGDERRYEQAEVRGTRIDCFLNEEKADHDYVWVDEENRCFVIMNSSLPHEMNLKIWESFFVPADRN